MIQIRRLLTLLLLVLAMGLAANAQTYTREDNTFISSTGERVKAGRPEISQQICKELGVKYINKKGNKQ